MGPWCDPCTYQGVLSPGLCLCGQAGGLGRVRSRSDVPRIWVLPEPPGMVQGFVLSPWELH